MTRPLSVHLLVVLSPFVLVAGLPVRAFAQTKAQCLAAASVGQQDREAHKLIDARDQLRICAAATCPAAIQTDCATWLAEVDRAIPAVIVSARDASGNDLIDVAVSVDGKPLLARLTGQATPIDAGPHTFHFEANGAKVDRQVLVREAAKDQSVAVVLGPAGPATPAPTGVTSTPAPPPTPADTSVPSSSPQSSPSSPLRTAGWVVGGVGIAGLAAGAIAGAVALSDKSSAHCDGNACQGPVDGVKSAAVASNIGFIVGGVLVAGGVGLVIFAPKGGGAAAAPAGGAGLRVVPMVTADGGGLMTGGTF